MFAELPIPLSVLKPSRAKRLLFENTVDAEARFNSILTDYLETHLLPITNCQYKIIIRVKEQQTIQ